VPCRSTESVGPDNAPFPAINTSSGKAPNNYKIISVRQPWAMLGCVTAPAHLSHRRWTRRFSQGMRLGI